MKLKQLIDELTEIHNECGDLDNDELKRQYGVSTCMDRPKKVNGLCGSMWVQTQPAEKGHVNFECSHDDGQYARMDITGYKETCIRICSSCKVFTEKMNG